MGRVILIPRWESLACSGFAFPRCNIQNAPPPPDSHLHDLRFSASYLETHSGLHYSRLFNTAPRPPLLCFLFGNSLGITVQQALQPTIQSDPYRFSLWTPPPSPLPQDHPLLIAVFMSTKEPREKQRRRRKHAFGGCGTCRRRHVKCDQARPLCLTCRAVGVDCEGYSSDIRWMPQATLSSASTTKDAEIEEISSNVTRRHLYSG